MAHDSAVSQPVRVLCLGSLNIDDVYQVNDIVRPGQTITTLRHTVSAGGKGANQAVALSRSGALVSLAGKVGADGRWLIEKLQGLGVDIDLVEVLDEGQESTGRAIIQVARTSGQNCILLYPGANHAISAANLEHIMNTFQPRPGELLLLQNEISMMPEALTLGRSHDLTVVWNPAPALTIADDHAQAFDLDAVDLIVVNEDEATVLYEQLRQRESNQQAATGTTQGSKKNRELARNQLTPCLPLDPKTPDDFLAVAERLHQALPDLSGVVITMGAGGVVYHFKSGRKYRTRLEGHYQAPSPASLLGHHCHTRLNNEGNGSAVIDTTGAGDTWVGFFVGYLSQHTPATERGQPIELPPRTLATAVRAASIAAGLSVTKPGAMDSMPNWEEVERLL